MIRALAALLLALAASAAQAQAQAELPPSLREHAPALRSAGSGRLTWFGFTAYDARLWVAPGFRAGAFERHLFALELTYLRNFSAADIARRSLEEMRRADTIAPQDAQRWQAALEKLLPDVKPGDRITGVHRPERGALFLVNGKPAGELAEPRFARNFFAIWLGPATSEPALREALLSGTAP